MRPDDVKHVFHARFLDVVPQARIVYAYAMQGHRGGTRESDRGIVERIMKRFPGDSVEIMECLPLPGR